MQYLPRMIRFGWLVLLMTLSNVGRTQEELYTFAQEGFVKELVPADVGFPTGVTFDGNGTGYVWTKAGTVHRMVEDIVDPTPWLDLTLEVGDNADHGLLGFALDPDFLTNGHFYVCYKVDRNYLVAFGTPDYVPDANAGGATIGRVARYTADIANDLLTVNPDTRLVLLGEDPTNGIPLLHLSHGMGALVFGADGSLMLTCGDGSTYTADYGGGGPPYYGEDIENALNEGIIPPEQEVGAFRAQQVQSYNGSVLRFNPETGEGYPSNPFYDPAQPNAAISKVYAYGFRNPYRFTLRPGTGSTEVEDGMPGQLVLCDVGGGRREEVNVISVGGGNYGWPLREGIGVRAEFAEQLSENPYTANPLAGGECPDFHRFRDLMIDPSVPQQSHSNACDTSVTMITPWASVHVPPVLEYRNKWSGANGDGAIPVFNADGELEALNIDTPESGIGYDNLVGFGAIGGDFYEGTTFPQELHELYFMADYDGWIKAVEFSPTGDVLIVEDFLVQTGVPIYHLEYNPVEDAFYMLEFPGLIHKIYAGEDVKPDAVFDATPSFGTSPLAVSLDATASSSPIGLDLSYAWLIDGTAYTGPTLNITLGVAGMPPTEFPVELTVTDTDGNSAVASGSLSLNNTPPTAQIATFGPGEFYPTDETSFVPLSAWTSDNEQGTLDHHWQVLLHHNTHYHVDQESQLAATATNVAPIGCDGVDYWFRLRYTGDDGAGLTATSEVELFPYCGPLTVPHFTEVSISPNDQGNQLTWTIDLPENTERLVIYRGADPFALFPIDTLNTGTAASGTYLDGNVFTHTAHYALKLFTPDQAFRFSNTEEVENDLLTPRLTAWPNPASRWIHFASSHCNEVFEAQLIDATGRTAMAWEGTCEGSLQWTADVSGMSPGRYTARLVSQSTVLTVGVVIWP